MRKRQPRSLSGKVAVVTGGARGIGRATAAALVAEGVRVAIGDIDGDQAQRTATELGSGTVGFRVDVAKPDSFREFLSGAQREFGPIDIFVNNAGILPLGPFVDESDDLTLRTLEVNVAGVMLGSKLALERLLPRETGHIVNVASTAGKVGLAGGVSYCASKHAVVGVSESLRAELVGTGVEVHLVMPTPVATDMAAGQRKLRGIKFLAAADVADAIVDALRTGRYEIFVPRIMGPMLRSSALLPRPLADFFGRLIGTRRVLAKADPLERAPYSARIASQSEAERSAADRAASVASAAASVADAVGDH
jgi:NAD(P)-dependent dehydrogenase (short-subunit alcohol dehydrogenase family)